MSATKTTAEERAAWRDRLRGAYGGVNRHPELPFQSLDEAERCLDDLDSALSRNDELDVELGRFKLGATERINELVAENAKQAERITELDAMIQRLGAALVRCSDDFLKLADADKKWDEEVETMLSQLEARLAEKKPS
jgi:chromosome segregation ATPase